MRYLCAYIIYNYIKPWTQTYIFILRYFGSQQMLSIYNYDIFNILLIYYTNIFVLVLAKLSFWIPWKWRTGTETYRIFFFNVMYDFEAFTCICCLLHLLVRKMRWVCNVKFDNSLSAEPFPPHFFINFCVIFCPTIFDWYQNNSYNGYFTYYKVKSFMISE